MARPQRNIPEVKQSLIEVNTHTRRIRPVEAKPESKTEPTITERPKRPTKANLELSLEGGYVKNVPDSCKKKNMDKDGAVWADATVCYYKCQDRMSCKVFDFIESGRKTRINQKG